MAFTLPTTNKTQIIRLTKALYDAAPGNTYLTAFEGYVAEANLATFANWMASTISTNPATLAAAVVANLHLTGAVATAATTFLTDVLTANPTHQGEMILASMNGLATLTADATYGAAAIAFNTSVSLSYEYSIKTANSTTDFATLQAADEVSALSPATTLTTGFDNLLGTAGNDSFRAYIRDNTNTLNSDDIIDGGAGTDVLWADMGTSSNFSVTPITTSVEEIRVRGEAVPGDTKDGNNMTQAVNIDAQRMSGVTTWASDNSRSDVIIEDVRINSNISTIEFKESDPGNVDFGVYFNQRNLVNTTGGSSSLNIFVMDTAAANDPATAAKPLLNMNFNAYTYYANGILVTLGGAGTAAGTAIDNATTYAELQAAFTLALKTANVGGTITDVSSTVTATLSAPVNMTTAAAANTTSAPVAASFLNLTGQILTLTSSQAGIVISATGAPGSPAAGWIASGPAPITGAITQTYSVGSTNSAALVNTNIILDDVGMGSTGGDLLVGGMSTGDTSTSKGIERFNITVKDNSKVQTINSTDNTLREVVIVNGTTSSESTAYVTTTKDAGDLTVNGNALGQAVSASNQTMAGANTGATATHQGANAAGFTDVRLINASAMTGKFAFTAAITSDSIAKYIPLADTQVDPYADIATDNTVGLGANFDYKGGTNNDTMSVTIDGAVAASRSTILTGHTDFTFSIDGGAGNDVITVDVVDATNALVGGIENWAANQDLNDNITITAGAGNDTIRIPGSGDTKILAGAGNDTIYTDNTGIQTGLNAGTGASITALGTGTSSKGIWVFNTYDQANAVASGNARNIYDLRSDANDSYNLYKATLTVTFKNIPSISVALPANTNYKTTDLEINQAIKNAINNDATLSKLLLAQDGPGNTLIVTSLIDDTMATGDLAVTVTAATTGYTAAELTALQTAWGVASGAEYTSQVAVAAAITAAGGDYVTQMAQDAAGVNIVGAASTSTSDNFITPGTDNDVIVLGTTVGVDAARSSNEVITLEAGFGNDVILNFATTGNGIDHLNLGAFISSTAATLTGALHTTNNLVSVVAKVVGTNDTDALVSTIVKTADNAVSASTVKQVYIVYDASNVGKIYSVVDGTAAGDATATLQGTIDLANVAWTTLTAASFNTVGAQAEGASSAVISPVLNAVINNQVLVGTTGIDTFNTGAFTGVSMTGLSGADIFNISAAGAIITDLATGDSINVTAAGTLATCVVSTAGFVATAATANAGTATLTANSAGATIDMSLATGTVGYTLAGAAGNDTLTGSAFADTLTSGATGTDVLNGGAGNDILTSGGGTVTFNGGAGNDTINCAGGVDTVNVTSGVDTVTAFGTAGADVITVSAGAAANVTVGASWTAAATSSNAGVLNMTLGAAGTTLNLAAMTGTVGVTVTGNAGANTVIGTALNDVFVGGGAVDTFTGGAGADIMSGAAGADLYNYGAKATVVGTANVDKITDFKVAGADVIRLDATGNAAAGAILNGLTLVAGNGFAALAAATSIATAVASIDDVYTAIAANAGVTAALTASAAGAASLIAHQVTFTTGAAAGDYLIINDSVAGFQAANDIVINVTGLGAAIAAADLAVI